MYYRYMFINRERFKSGIVYVSSTMTGGRPVSGADVETLARTQEHNFIDTIMIDQLSYTATPAEYIEKEKEMSNALWCDQNDSETNAPGQIGHSFSSRDKGRKTIVFTEFDDAGEPHTVQGDSCGYHARRNPFFGGQKAITKVEEAKVKGYDPEYVEWLEKRNKIGEEE